MPDTVPVHPGLFTTDEEGGASLLAGRCRACTRLHFPRAAVCQYCGSDDVEEARLSSPGSLWAWTAVTAAPPGYRGEVPFGFGVVELPEGLRVLTRLTEPDPARLRFGQEVHLSVAALHVDDEGHTVVTWAYGP
jgi:uncharacterized OB-fold protein